MGMRCRDSLPYRLDIMDHSDTWVRFRIRDIYIPEPSVLLDLLHGADELRGRIIALSETTAPDGVYAVIEVAGIARPLIVPAEALEMQSDIR